MNTKLAIPFLLAFIVSLIELPPSNVELTSKPLSTAETLLTFKDFKITSIKEKEVQLKAITENAGVRQVTDIRVNIDGGTLAFVISVLPNDRNVTINYRGSIKLK